MTKYTKVDPALQQELQKIVESLSVPGKGIWALDESSSSLDAKFRQIGIENTETARRDYREMLLSADKVFSFVLQKFSRVDSNWGNGNWKYKRCLTRTRICIQRLKNYVIHFPDRHFLANFIVNSKFDDYFSVSRQNYLKITFFRTCWRFF